MYKLIMILYWFSFFSGAYVFVSFQKHLLAMLLSLEFLVLILFGFLLFFLMFSNFQDYFSLIYLTFSVCEGVLGLSILVMMIRSHGNDFFQSFSILKC
nr:NADH dehydrogenase subunit 4L [Systropus sp. 2 YXA-2022a]